eukprot:snap_masked-scaffold35_size523699-processed-gene-1.23 protein:Tk06287 transcript:snap_masked-scaffold35_size523699-processed-gene-1.23-mRNA-1 annotation:"purine nucleoside phosphoramidase"
MPEQHPDNRVELVNGAVSLNTLVIFCYAAAIAQARFTSITRAENYAQTLLAGDYGKCPAQARTEARYNTAYSLIRSTFTVPTDTLFSKIIKGEIPADVVFQDELVTAFRDINPAAPTHILIVPNKIIPTAADVQPEDELALGRLFTVARKLAEEEGIEESGYRLVVNCKDDGRQEVMHLHMHLLGGRDLGRSSSRHPD